MRMIYVALLLLAAGCSLTVAKKPATPMTPDQADRAYLLESAAADFHRHGPAPTQFRDVRFGYVEGAGGTQMALVCGKFQTADKPGEWIEFATLKTSKYEQWIGDRGNGFCQRPPIEWQAEDLSGQLQQRVQALR